MRELAESLKAELAEASRSAVEKRAKDAGLRLVFKDSWYKLFAKPGTIIDRRRVIFPVPVAASVNLKDIVKWLDKFEKRIIAKRY